MATITDTLITGLSQAHVQARLDGIDATKWYFGKHFPVEEAIDFRWSTLANQIHERNIAADLHADNASVIRKSRPIFQSANGDIPRLAISREMDRQKLKEYQIMRNRAKGKPNAAALVKYWGEDVDFCFNGIQAECEFIAWKLASNAGVLKFTTATNTSFANEYDLDYQVDEQLKQHTTKSFADKDTDVVEELRQIIDRMTDELHLTPRFIFLNRKTLRQIVMNESVIKLCSPQLAVATDTTRVPSLQTLNEVFPTIAGFEDIQFRVIHQIVTRENADGTFTSGNPFADNRLVISETEQLGHTAYSTLEEPDNKSVIKAVRKHTVIKKYGNAEPISEVTIGEADAIPVFDTASRCVYVKTDAQAW